MTASTISLKTLPFPTLDTTFYRLELVTPTLSMSPPNYCGTHLSTKCLYTIPYGTYSSLPVHNIETLPTLLYILIFISYFKPRITHYRLLTALGLLL